MIKKTCIIIVAILVGLSISSCEKDNLSSMEGTWSFVEEGAEDSGDFVHIKDGIIAIYYGSGEGLDFGLKYKFENKSPHIFIAGVNAYDVVSVSSNRMVWKDSNYGQQYILTKAKDNGIESIVGEWVGKRSISIRISEDESTSTYDIALNITDKAIETEMGGANGECLYEYANPYVILIGSNIASIYKVVKTGQKTMEWEIVNNQKYITEDKFILKRK